MSIVNLSFHVYSGMIEMIEAIGYVALGFTATFAAMEAAWRIAKKRYMSAMQTARAA